MTITLLSPDGVAVTAQQERQAKAAQHGGGAGRPLGGRSGFRVGTPSNVLTATSTTWTLGPCAAEIDPGATTHQGMYGWASDQNISGSITAADATYARKDIVYIQINDPTAGDSTGSLSYTPQYLAGTPSASPAAPALPARAFLVGTINVPQVGGGSPTVVVNTARYVAAGAPLPVYSQAERDALTAYDGLRVMRMDLPGRPIETYDGAVWIMPPQGQIAAAAYPSDTGDIAYNFLAIIAEVTTPSVAAGRKLRITLETDAYMTASNGITAIGLNQGGTTGNPDGTQLRNSAVAYLLATSTQSADLTYHFTTTAAGPQRFYATCKAVLPGGAAVHYPPNGRRITVYDDGAA